MFVDDMEPADVAILDAALSAERLEQQAEAGSAETIGTDGESFRARWAAPRGALSGVLVGLTLWAVILVPVFRR